MKKPITINIPKPCRELDQNGTVVDKGIYCTSCKKVVTGFTTKTQNEIYDIITQSKEEMCGRFYAHQLNTPIVKHELKTSPFNLKAIAAALASLFGVQAWAGGGGSSPVMDTEQVSASSDTTALVQSAIQNNDTTLLKVQVLDKETGKPVIGCMVTRLDIYKSCHTDSAGFFSVEKVSPGSSELEPFKVSALGYTEITMTIGDVLNRRVIFLEPTNIFLYTVGIIDYSPAPKIQKPKK